jgi:aerobic-type carbon monoxide dehydrogenase small subunit (CoxS/CutS family)
MEQTIRFVLNGKKTEIQAKYGCGMGFCGACTVIINDEAVRSCTLPVSEISGKKIVTIEGLEKNGKLHPVQQAFVDHDALQCGFCTPGMVMNAVALLTKNPKPTRQEIVNGMEDNLCRCAAHIRIIQAVETAATVMKGGK